MKDLVIGCVQGYQPSQVAPWINSLNHSGFDGDIVVINFGVPQETVDFLHRRGVKIVNTQPTSLHIVVDRFINVYTYLKEHQGEYRYVLSTDMKDIVIQEDPFILIDCCLDAYDRILVSSENIRYQDEGWGNENLKSSYPHMYDLIKEYPIYNAGAIAGKSEDLRDFCLHIYHLSLISQNRQPDQAAMNILLATRPFSECSLTMDQSHGFVANLGTTLADKVKDSYKDKWIEAPPIITDQGIVNPETGDLFAIVHQYDRVSGLYGFYQNKFGDLK